MKRRVKIKRRKILIAGLLFLVIWYFAGLIWSLIGLLILLVIVVFRYNGKFTIATRIAGLRYRCEPTYLDKIKVGDKVMLKLDENNQYDKYAVKVINKIDNKHLGFIPSNLNKEKNIWKKVKECRLADCYVKRMFRNPPTWLNSHSIYINMEFKRIKNVKFLAKFLYVL